jgi:hypothetical protein
LPPHEALSWNIRHGGDGNGSLAPALMMHERDVIVLCEYRVEGSAKLVEQLRSFWLASRCGEQCCRERKRRCCGVQRAHHPYVRDAGRFAVRHVVGGDECSGIRPDSHRPLRTSAELRCVSPLIQRQFWEAVHRLADIRRDERLVMVGDFNTCAPGPRWTAQNRPLIDTSKPATTGVAAETNGVLLRSLFRAQVGVDLGAPAAWPALEHVGMVQQAIKQRRDGRGVAEQLAPVVHGSI